MLHLGTGWIPWMRHLGAIGGRLGPSRPRATLTRADLPVRARWARPRGPEVATQNRGCASRARGGPTSAGVCPGAAGRRLRSSTNHRRRSGRLLRGRAAPGGCRCSARASGGRGEHRPTGSPTGAAPPIRVRRRMPRVPCRSRGQASSRDRGDPRGPRHAQTQHLPETQRRPRTQRPPRAPQHPQARPPGQARCAGPPDPSAGTTPARAATRAATASGLLKSSKLCTRR